MKNDSNFSAKTKRYSLAGVLIVMGTFLIQFESNGPRFIAVLAIVIAGILFFKPRLLDRKNEEGSVYEVESSDAENVEIKQ